MNEELRKEIFSLPAIATFLGTAIAIWTLVEKNAAMTFSVLATVVFILFGYLFAFHRRNSDHKRRIQSLSEDLSIVSKRLHHVSLSFHMLTHRSRDYLSDARTSTSKNERQDQLDAAIKMALTTASGNFTHLLGVPCSASMMIRQRDGRFRTVYYCHNANPQRESKGSDPLHASQGIVGKALATGDVVLWGHKDHIFVRTRPDYEKFYRSGLCVPFKKSYVYQGVLNIDCLNDDGFAYEDHKELGAAYADMLGLLLECNDVLGGHLGNA
jgi:hypothetical protein